MTTDNRTNEPSHNRITIQDFRDGEVSVIREDRVRAIACTLDELKRAVATYEARGALEDAGRPAGTFTEAQVEAAAKAMYEEERSQTLEGQQWPRWHELCEDNPWSSRCGHKGTKVPYLTLARAALVAAQGAAPQAGQCGARWLREEGSENIPPGDWHCALPLNHGGNHVDGADGTRWGRHRDYGGVPGDAVGTFYPPTGAAPVLPSSGVDEDALAEVIAKSRGFGNGWEQIPPLTRGAYREIARAVAEWLKGQGR